MHLLFVFFFKQKTAYEIVSRDWSSDVCSSDLESKFLGGDMEHTHLVKGLDYALLDKVRAEINNKEIGRASCRERV